MKREGIVKWYKEEKGYGRIMLNGEDKNHVFVHFSSVLPNNEKFPDGYRFLKQGQKVSFDLIEQPHSTDQKQVAENVEILSD
ncbi:MULTISPECIES: cold-shock protein [unclassified Lysinibacillus]|uniref:cold-shock protein n=1 Tax=unclassified Lysinibacillus TaxID=2636778 RepID=UPI0030F73FFC